MAGYEFDEQQTTLAYVSDNFYSGASIQLSFEEGKNRLTFEQFGLANVLVVRPKTGLIFPTEKDFHQKNSFLENSIPTLIEPNLLPGDLIVIIIPLDLSKEVNSSPKAIVDYILSMSDPEDSLQVLASVLGNPKDQFISISKLERQTKSMYIPHKSDLNESETKKRRKI